MWCWAVLAVRFVPSVAVIELLMLQHTKTFEEL